MSNRSTVRKKYIYLLDVLIFCFFYFFFIKIHPVVLFDADDWYYIFGARKAVPVVGEWNPSRILPELLMPMVGFIAGHIFQNDFTWGMTVGFAVTISLFITVYFHIFHKLIIVITKNRVRSVFFLLICLVSHFLIFRSSYRMNSYMFWSYDATGYFYYTIPALLNCSLVMWIMIDDILVDFFKTFEIKKAVFILLVYLAVFSNLYLSAILPIYLFVSIIQDIITCSHRGNQKISLQKYKYKLGIIGVWVISAIFELTGGRSKARYLNSQGSISERAYDCLKATYHMVLSLNRFFVLFFVVILLISFFIAKNNRNRLAQRLLLIFSCSGLLGLFEMGLSIVTVSTRTQRADVMFGVFFFLILGFIVTMAHICENIRIIDFILPLLALIMIAESNTTDVTFLESNRWNYSPKTLTDVTSDIIEQIQTAVDNGEDSVEVRVLQSEFDDNFPHAYYIKYRFLGALLKCGVIERSIDIELVPDINYNLSFNMEILEHIEE